MAEQAEKLIPDGHPSKPVGSMNILHCLLQPYRRSGEFTSPDVLRRAILCSSQATHCRTSSFSHRFQASEVWILCLRVLSY
ncbi:hypothetical protein JVU11DRAFT_7323 [Chiua virens]|nr:hypothetical protein JVU11DRAFT_7323 [Chiua virens]